MGNKDGPSDISMVLEASGRRAGEALLFVGEILQKREEEIIKSVMNSLKGNSALDPGLAVERWVALSEVKNLRKSLEASSTRGQSASKRNSVHRGAIG